MPALSAGKERPVPTTIVSSSSSSRASAQEGEAIGESRAAVCPHHPLEQQTPIRAPSTVLRNEAERVPERVRTPYITSPLFLHTGVWLRRMREMLLVFCLSLLNLDFRFPVFVWELRQQWKLWQKRTWFERRTFADPFEVYRALRIVKPSPYMTYLQICGD